MAFEWQKEKKLNKKSKGKNEKKIESHYRWCIKIGSGREFYFTFFLLVWSLCQFNIFGTDVHYDFIRSKIKAQNMWRKVEKVQEEKFPSKWKTEYSLHK